MRPVLGYTRCGLQAPPVVSRPPLVGAVALASPVPRFPRVLPSACDVPCLHVGLTCGAASGAVAVTRVPGELFPGSEPPEQTRTDQRGSFPVAAFLSKVGLLRAVLPPGGHWAVSGDLWSSHWGAPAIEGVGPGKLPDPHSDPHSARVAPQRVSRPGVSRGSGLPECGQSLRYWLRASRPQDSVDTRGPQDRSPAEAPGPRRVPAADTCRESPRLGQRPRLCVQGGLSTPRARGSVEHGSPHGPRRGRCVDRPRAVKISLSSGWGGSGASVCEWVPVEGRQAAVSGVVLSEVTGRLCCVITSLRDSVSGGPGSGWPSFGVPHGVAEHVSAASGCGPPRGLSAQRRSSVLGVAPPLPLGQWCRAVRT